MAKEQVEARVKLTHTYMKGSDRNGLLYLLLEGGTFRTGDLKGRYDLIATGGMVVHFEDDDPLDQWAILPGDFIEAVIAAREVMGTLRGMK